MRHKLVPLFALAVGLLSATVPLFAHHGGSEYDMQHLVTRKATVTKLFWENPHCYMFVDVKDAGGKSSNWGLEMSSPAFMERQEGWSAHTVQVGDEITVTFAPSKKGTPIGHVEKVVLANGKVLRTIKPGEQPEY